ncbi:MAG: tRNA dimethylallyltransferase [Bacteroidaceae bacterium]|nr:tRNA dimethylallyltransferase [Bacteroidaceae bacterium]
MSHLLTILGPTACGKTSFATQLASRLDGEIISADSRQVFRGMDIGTGKDLSDYIVNGHPVPYHLIDIAEPGTRYSVYQFQHDFHAAYNDITSRGKTPILCGGTGLYIESVIRGYEFDGRKLPPLQSLNIGLLISREERRRKISLRLQTRLDEGMIDEVKRLMDRGVPADTLIRYGLEYKYVTLHLLGRLSYDEMYRQLEIAIHQFAKRQMTWFRGMEQRRGIPIHWLSQELPLKEKIETVENLWKKKTAGA